MIVNTGWQELTTNRKKQCPKLYYSYAADEKGIKLRFTDLIALWAAEASSDAVREHAKFTKTSIDPDSKSQLRVLLQKLGQSLAEGTNVLKKDEGSDSEAVLLETTLTLPRPLEPLKWQFHLESQGSGQMAEHILRPCLFEASESAKKIDTLIGTIETKDHIISRLLEKIEGSSMDLSLIFPGITGARARKGQVTIKDAQKHVPGLREFNKAEWKEFFNSDSNYASFETAGLFRLAVESCPKHTPQQHEKWLEKLPKATATTSQVAQSALYRSSSPVRPDTDSDNEFETQKKRNGAAKQRGSYDSSDTESDEERPLERRTPRKPDKQAQSPLGSSPPPLPPPPSEHIRSHSSSSTDTEASSVRAPSSKPKGRIGHLGLKSKPVPARSARKTQPPSSSPPPSRPVTTAPVESSSPPPEPPTTNTNTKRPKSSSSAATASAPSTPRKLGRLGGSRKATESATPEKKAADEQQQNSTQNTPSRRLGRLGRGASQPASQAQHTMHNPDAKADDEMPDVAAHDTSHASSPIASPSRNKSQTKHNLGRLKHSSSPVPQTEAGDASATSRSQSQHQSINDKQEEAEPEPEEELTKEEKANRRREELKRKIGHTSAATASNTGLGNGLRKKRKF
ncbi:hypothetical protein OHC33_006600 [Knufia fluminis]|uniref:Non-homologous end-joining factor 1 n=1 Tax=Knufia fluminis TaxID=191047 RepID=A0AAN8ECV8_9EURO|nr:hypothetical protein OHC33_006600 [Knufia fluminis]